MRLPDQPSRRRGLGGEMRGQPGLALPAGPVYQPYRHQPRISPPVRQLRQVPGSPRERYDSVAGEQQPARLRPGPLRRQRHATGAERLHQYSGRSTVVVTSPPTCCTRTISPNTALAATTCQSPCRPAAEPPVRQATGHRRRSGRQAAPTWMFPVTPLTCVMSPATVQWRPPATGPVTAEAAPGQHSSTHAAEVRPIGPHTPRSRWPACPPGPGRSVRRELRATRARPATTAISHTVTRRHRSITPSSTSPASRQHPRNGPGTRRLASPWRSRPVALPGDDSDPAMGV